MTKEIPLTRGYVAIVDDEDFELVSQYRWVAVTKKGYTTYAGSFVTTDGKRHQITMHRLVMNFPTSSVDHINGDGLDNRRSTNLRVATVSQNLANRGAPSNNTSGFKGVWWDRVRSVWVASIYPGGKHKRLGSFSTAAEAAHAYNKKAIELFGEFAYLNQIDDEVQAS